MVLLIDECQFSRDLYVILRKGICYVHFLYIYLYWVAKETSCLLICSLTNLFFVELQYQANSFHSPLLTSLLVVLPDWVLQHFLISRHQIRWRPRDQINTPAPYELSRIHYRLLQLLLAIPSQTLWHPLRV